MFAAVLAAVYTVLSARRQYLLQTSGYDMGIFVQSATSWSQLHWPVSTLKGPHYPLLGNHFSPIVALVGPIYRLFPSADTLLVIQAVLLAVAVVPLMQWARRAVGAGSALLVGVVYGLSFGVAGAVGFDWHEIAFAVPLLAFSCTALGNRRFVAAIAAAAPLLLVKEDLGLTVAAIGVIVAVRSREHRLLGGITAGVGVLGTVVEITVILPAINLGSSYGYTGQLSAGLDHGLTTKLTTVLMLLAIAGFLAQYSSIAVITIPTLCWRFGSDNPAYWGTGYHYSAVLMPIVLAAFVEVLARPSLAGWLRRGAQCVALVATLLLLPAGSLWQLTSAEFYRPGPQVAATHRLLSQIPSNVTVSASNNLAAQLASRDDVSLFGKTPLSVSKPAYIVVDRGYTGFPITAQERDNLLAGALATNYRQLASAGPVVLLERTGKGGAGAPVVQSAAWRSPSTATRACTFGTAMRASSSTQGRSRPASRPSLR